MPPLKLLAGVPRARIGAIPASRAIMPLALARPAPILVRPTFRTFVTSRRALEQSQRENLESKLHRSRAAASFHDPITRYEFLVNEGILKPDQHQREIVKKLMPLWERLETYDPGPLPDAEEVEPSFFGKFFTRKTTYEPTVPLDEVPKGLYLYGSVGTGKTMLMDLFHSTLPKQFQPGGKYGSTRIHFHSFMIEVLQRQHAVTARYVAEGDGKRDAIPEVARSIAADGRVLCFDEFQVTDIVTAMLLRSLFERLTDFGVVTVITSNRHPDELYINGIQRESFIPAIDLIKERFDIVDLNSGTDYRKMPRTITHVYYHPLNPETASEMDKLFHGLASADTDPEIKFNRKLPLWGRELTVPESSAHVARFTFDDLCNHPLSAADYLEITATFPNVFVEDVPKLTLSERDQARRFITFIDACYENKTKLFLSSNGPIYNIFSDENASSMDDDTIMKTMSDLGINTEVVGSSSLFSSDEELFAFARCVSRLTQMATKEWADESALSHPIHVKKEKA
ncbi:hypothetical protein CspeluHIS016_0207030 [Cutaneotrichosporon spelunceum]|uniref:AFG1-like ATPase n=1 Tax=Cutaneotrichosporon spelunceum TaxID=1672016 RepID=A0AAD3TSE9_9TREE|nr:hypothetical protein CspeluHIS016_0207030 [Cutaneotrichosporon spelunceum]